MAEHDPAKLQQTLAEGLASMLAAVETLKEEVRTLRTERAAAPTVSATVEATGNATAASSSSGTTVPPVVQAAAEAAAAAAAPLVLSVQTGANDPHDAEEASAKEGSDIVDNFTKRRATTVRKKNALGDWLDGDESPVKSPNETANDIVQRGRRVSKLGDWLDSPTNKTEEKGESKSSGGKLLWKNAKSKLLTQMRDNGTSPVGKPRSNSIANVVEAAQTASSLQQQQRKMSVGPGSSVTAPRRRSVMGQELQLTTRRRTAIGLNGELGLSPSSSPTKASSSSPLGSSSPVATVSETSELKEEDEVDDENGAKEPAEPLDNSAMGKCKRLLGWCCCEYSDRTHPAYFTEERRSLSADFFFRRGSSYVDSVRVKIGNLLNSDITDQSTVRGLDLYLDVNSGSKEFVVQNEFPQIVILPDSVFLIAWQLTIALAVVMSAFATPFDAAFDVNKALNRDGILGGWESVFTGIFIMDIIVNFITGIRDIQGHVQLKGSTIALHYAKSPWLFLDVVSVVPWGELAALVLEEEMNKNDDGGGGAGNSASAVKTLKLLRLFRLSKVIKRLDEFMEMGALQVLVLILGVTMFLHWISCGWMGVGCDWMAYTTAALSNDGSGIESTLEDECRNGASNTKMLRRMYGACLAQACGSMLGSGNAITFPEQLYFASVIIMGAVMQASVFGSIAKTMAQMDEDRHKFDRQVAQINYRMRYLRLPEKVQAKVIKYYDNLWNFTKTSESDPDKFINTLSPPLRGEMKLALYRNMLTKMPYLRNLDVILAERLVMKLKSVSFMKGDFIMRVGEPGDWLAFLEQGTAAILDPSSCDLPLDERRVIRVMETGDYFGEVSLFFGTRRTADVLAMSWTILELLDRSAWDSLKRDFAEEMEELETSIKADTSSWMKSQRK